MKKLNKTLTMLILCFCVMLGFFIGGISLINNAHATSFYEQNNKDNSETYPDGKPKDNIGDNKIGLAVFSSRVSYFIKNTDTATQLIEGEEYYEIFDNSEYPVLAVKNGDFVFFDEVKQMYVSDDYQNISEFPPDSSTDLCTIPVSIEQRVTIGVSGEAYNLTIVGKHGTSTLNTISGLSATTIDNLDFFETNFSAEGWYDFLFEFRYRDTNTLITSGITQYPWNFYIVKKSKYFVDPIRPTFTNDPNAKYTNEGNVTRYYFNYSGDGSTGEKLYPELTYNIQKFDLRMRVDNYMGVPLYDSGINSNGTYPAPNYSSSKITNSTTANGQMRSIEVWEIGKYTFTSKMYYVCDWDGGKRVPINNYSEHIYELYIFGYQMFYNDYQTNKTTWFGGRNGTDSDVTLQYNMKGGVVEGNKENGYAITNNALEIPDGITPVVTNQAPVFPQHMGTLKTSYYKYRPLYSDSASWTNDSAIPNKYAKGQYAVYEYNERTNWFTQAGYYQLFVNYTFSVNGTLHNFYQVFYFIIKNTTTDVTLLMDGFDSYLIDNLNPTNQYIVTNQNISLTWTTAGVYELAPRIEYAMLSLGTVDFNAINFKTPTYYTYSNGTEFTNSNIYIFRISHGLHNELPRYITVVLDKQPISGANAINLKPNGTANPDVITTTMLNNGTNTFSYYGAGDTYLEWNPKTSGAWFDEQKTQYRYTPLAGTDAWDNSASVAVFTTAYELTIDTTEWKTYNFKWDSTRGKWAGESFNQAGLYEFLITDLAGNTLTYYFFIDDISPIIYQNQPSISPTQNIVNKETEIRWGQNKVIQLNDVTIYDGQTPLYTVPHPLRTIFGTIYSPSEGGIIVPIDLPVEYTRTTEIETLNGTWSKYEPNYIIRRHSDNAGEHFFLVSDILGNKSGHSVKMNFDGSLGTIYANDESMSFGYYYIDTDDNDKEKFQYSNTLSIVDTITRANSTTSNLTNRDYIRFEFAQKESFPVQKVSYAYYALEYNNGTVGYSEINSAPADGILYDLYADPTYINSAVASATILCEIINPSFIAPNKTQPGIYVITRVYEGDPAEDSSNYDEDDNQLDFKEKDYIFIVDRNGTITSNFDNGTKLEIGQGTNFTTFNNFNRRDNNFGLNPDTEVFLVTNKLPIVIRVPLNKYNLTANILRDGKTIKTNALNLLITLECQIEQKMVDGQQKWVPQQLVKNVDWDFETVSGGQYLKLNKDGSGNIIINPNAFYKQGIYRIVISDGSMDETWDSNTRETIMANTSEILFEVKNDIPMGNYLTQENAVVNHTTKNINGDTQTSVQIKGDQKLMFTFEDPGNEYLSKIDPAKTVIMQTMPNSTTTRNITNTGEVTMTRYIDQPVCYTYIYIGNDWVLYNASEHSGIENPNLKDVYITEWVPYNASEHGSVSNPRFKYEYSLPTKGLNGIVTEYLYQITISYVGQQSHYDVPDADNFYSNTVLIKIDNTAPSHNLNRVKAQDSWHTAESTSTYAFALSDSFTFTPATNVYNVNGDTKNYSVHDTYRIFYRQIGSIDDAVEIQGGGVNTSMFTEFAYSANNRGLPYGAFATVANHGSNLNAYYQIVEQDEAGNTTTYVVQLNTLSASVYPTLYYSANGVTNALISTATNGTELNLLNFEFTSLGNLVLNNKHFSVTINGQVFKYGIGYTTNVADYLTLLNNKVAAQNTKYNISINHRFGIINFTLNTPSATVLSVTYDKIGGDIRVTITTQLNATKLVSLKIESIENGLRYPEQEDKNGNDIWQSPIMTGGSTPAGPLTYWLRDGVYNERVWGEYVVTTVDNFGRENIVQIHGNYENRAELIFSGPTQVPSGETIPYTGRQVSFIYQSYIYSNLTVYRNGSIVPSFTNNYGAEGSGLRELTITPFADEISSYRIEIKNSLGQITVFSFNFYCLLPSITLENNMGDNITTRVLNNQTNSSVYLRFSIGSIRFNPVINVTRTYTENGQVRTEQKNNVQNNDPNPINTIGNFGRYTITVQNALTAVTSYTFEYTQNPITDFGIFLLKSDGTPDTSKPIFASPILKKIWVVNATGVVSLPTSSTANTPTGSSAINIQEYFSNQTFTSPLQQVKNMIKYDTDKEYTLTETKITGEEIYVYCLSGSEQFGPTQKIYFAITKIAETNKLQNSAANTININGAALSANQLFSITTGLSTLTTISWPAYNGANNNYSGNVIYVEYYYNGISGGTTFGTLSADGNRRSLELNSADTGEFLIVFKDMAGNIQTFTDTSANGRTMSYYSVYQVASVPVLVNGQTPVNNMTYNSANLTVQNFQLLSSSSYYLKGIEVRFNDRVEINHGYLGINTIRPQNTYNFTKVGNYVINLTYNVSGNEISSSISFNIVNPSIHRLGYNFTSANNCVVIKMIKDGAVIFNDPTGSQNRTSIFLDRSTGLGLYYIEIMYISTTLRPNEIYPFSVYINTNLPKEALRSTTPFGTETVDIITVYFNPAQLYNLYGTMTLQTIKASGNRQTTETFRITSGAENKEIPLRITETGTYTFRLVTDDGRVLYSEVIVKNTPLNVAAILLIVIAAIAGLTGIIFFIRMRTRMTVK